MKYLLVISLIFVVAFGACKKEKVFSEISIETLLDDSLSIRAIDIINDDLLFYAANKGTYGFIDINTSNANTATIQLGTFIPEFRAVAHTEKYSFMLSVGSPALLYKVSKNLESQLVYQEDGEGVFYDAMKFWDDKNGIAMGDRVGDCIAIIMTNDGGDTWHKIDCSKLPLALENEGAFAASNTNIEIKGDHVWIATTSSRIYHSPDRGKSWEVYQTPIVNQKPTEGIYSIDFYNEKIGVAIGGDYTNEKIMTANKAITKDGGLSWSLLANGVLPGYKSCIQFVPGSNGQELIAVGFSGIAYSCDQGVSWQELSDEPFYTIRFIDDSFAIAAGTNRISKLSFK